MTIELTRARTRTHAPTASSDGPRPGGGLEQLRERSIRHSQAARDAIARVLQAGRPEHQLDQLRNVSGQ